MKKKFLIELEAEGVYPDQTEERLDGDVQAYIDVENSGVTLNNTRITLRLLDEHVDVEKLQRQNEILHSGASPETVAALSCIKE